MDPLSLYIHIPFCISKCNYCDFCSYAGKTNLFIKYFTSLKKELEVYKHVLQERPLASIFFGGGTPTSIPESLLIAFLENIFHYAKPIKNCEISIESNPGTINQHSLERLFKAGFNRLSIGLQSIHENELKTLGRIHDYKDFVDAFENARKIGFRNINVDLMFGIPYQTLESWSKTLTNVLSYNPEHLSCYSLIIEEGTPFYNYRDNLQLPDEDEERKMYSFTKNYLLKNNYYHYEISNWSKAGMESYHNLNYWKCGDYIGLGVAAHSLLENKRFSNTTDIYEYIELSPAAIVEEDTVELGELDQMKEYMMLGFRLIQGINILEFSRKFNQEPMKIFNNELKMLANSGLISIDEIGFRLTEKGLDLANQVFGEFV